MGQFGTLEARPLRASFKLAAVNNFPLQLQRLNAATLAKNNVVVKGASG